MAAEGTPSKKADDRVPAEGSGAAVGWTTARAEVGTVTPASECGLDIHHPRRKSADDTLQGGCTDVDGEVFVRGTRGFFNCLGMTTKGMW